MSFVQEELVEGVALGHFSDLGYATTHGSTIGPGGDAQERADYKQTVLADRLNAALLRLNPDLPQTARDEAFRALTRTEHPDLVADNGRLHRLIVNGVEVEYRDPDTGQTRSARVRVIDLEDVANNDWLAVNQYTVTEHATRRPDVVVFINGLPVAVFELKNPADEDATVRGAYNQLQTYKHDIPSLFRHNAILVASDGISAAMGSLTAGWEHFAPWKTIDGDKEAATAMPQLEVLIRGAFDRQRLLDVISSFIVFSDEPDGLVKRLAKYHQYWAVKAAVASTVEAAAVNGDQRAGVVWHTQGSGKSLEMLIYATAVMRHPAMANPTLVLLTDRNDLDDQLYDEVFAPARTLPETPVQAESRDQLKELLTRPSGGIVFTTIQKFGVNAKGERFPKLSDRRNIVVIADEAHRSQYSFLDGFARHLRDGLPNATFIGFTGTPIELEDRSTKQVFGDYVHIYDVTAAIEDGATVPLYYESRLVKVALPDDVDVDERFDEVTETQEADSRDRLASRWSRMEAIVGATSRIEKVAADIVGHWEQRRETLAGKAMIVGMSRRICVDLYEQITKLRPDWHHDSDDAGKIKVVMTGSASDPENFQPHIRTKQGRRDLKARAKDPDDELELVIVRDMWLTGFDSPAMHTMYVDKPMKGHSLMQAIARVNRTWRDKPAGLIVDYIGIADNLRKALSVYSESDQRQVGVDIDVAAATLQDKYEVVTNILDGHDWSDARSDDPKKRLNALSATVDFVVGDPDRKQRFLDQTLALVKAYAIAVPHPKTDELRDDVSFLQAVRSQIAKLEAAGGAGRPSSEDLDTAISQVISEAVTATDVVDIFAEAGIDKPDLSILDDEFLAHIQASEHKNLQMEVLKKLIRDEIRSIRSTNVVQYRQFSEKLQKTINGYTNRALSTAEVIAELVELAKQMQAAQRRGEDLGLDEDELAFYEAVRQNDASILELGDDTLKEIAHELVETLKGSVTIDWEKKQTVRARIRANVKRLLRKHGYPPDQQQAAIELVMEQTELFSDKWSEAA